MIRFKLIVKPKGNRKCAKCGEPITFLCIYGDEYGYRGHYHIKCQRDIAEMMLKEDTTELRGLNLMPNLNKRIPPSIRQFMQAELNA